MYNIRKEVNSLSEYIEFIYEYKSKNKEELWYRGHSNNNWLLDATINRNKEIDFGDSEPGDVISLKYKNIPDFNEELNRFKKGLKGKIPEDFNDFHFMFLGQHYGLKTPALDWSTDPLVALYFALNEYEENDDTYPVVFILKPGMLNANSFIKCGKEAIKEPLVIDYVNNNLFNKWYGDINETPFHHIPFAVKSDLDISYRISRQSGVFTLLGSQQPMHYPWIQTNIYGEPFGITLKINPDAVESIRERLIALNITEDTIYGKAHKDWDELCEKIVRETPIL